MSIVTGKLIRKGWALRLESGYVSEVLITEEERSRKQELYDQSGQKLVPVAIIELPATPAPTDQFVGANKTIWPPKWGEGPVCGWCRRKADGALCRWMWGAWLISVASAAGNAGMFEPDEFAQLFEPA